MKLGWISTRIFPPVLLVAALSACGIPESVRQTNRLNADAARWIEQASPDPAIDGAAKNIEDGSAVIERKIGAPEVPIPYSPEAHAASVVKANVDVDNQEAVKKGISGFFETVVRKVADFAIPGAGGLIVGAFLWIRKIFAYDKLKKGAAVVINTIESHPEIKSKVMERAGKLGLGQVVDSVVQSVVR